MAQSLTLVDDGYTKVYVAIMLAKLGKRLKLARMQRGVSLQTVAVPAMISAAYLHKLEQGRVGTPSPRVLKRVGRELGVPYLELMVLAEYLEEVQAGELWSGEKPPEFCPLPDVELTEAESKAVAAFVELLVAQR